MISVFIFIRNTGEISFSLITAKIVKREQLTSGRSSVSDGMDRKRRSADGGGFIWQFAGQVISFYFKSILRSSSFLRPGAAEDVTIKLLLITREASPPE